MRFSELVTPQSGEGPRQAALLIHAMGASDREWLLASLPAQHQVQLRELLSELTSLSIPSDLGLLQHALVESPASAARVSGACANEDALALPRGDDSAGPLETADRDFLAQLGPVGVTALVSIFRTEPAQLVARCLQLQPWPWRQEVLDSLNQAQRRQVRDLLDRPGLGAVPASLSAALARELRQRCERRLMRSETSAQAGQIVISRLSRGGQGRLRTWVNRARGIWA